MLATFFLLIGAAIVAFVLDFFNRPERSVYFYLYVRFLFPKHLEMDLAGETVVLWRGAELAAFLVVVTVLFANRNRLASRLGTLPELRKFFLGLVVTLVISTFVPLFLALTGLRPRPVEVSILRQMFLATHYLYAVGVFLAGIVFLDTVSKIESLLKCLFVCGLVGLFDLVWLNWLDLAPAIREATTSTNGGFGGMGFGASDALGRGAIFGLFAGLALYKLRGSVSYLVLALSFLILIPASASRPIAFSAILALVFYRLIDHQKPAPAIVPFGRFLVVFICLLAPLGIAAFEGDVTGWVESATRREDFFSPDIGVLTRLAIWVRAVDVFVYTFPFGCGGGLLPFYMAGFKGASVTSYFGLPGRLQEFYQQLIEWRLSSVHNLYLEFIAENGLGGLILVLWFGVLVLHAFRRFLALRAGLETRTLALQVALFSILFAAALNVNTDATFKVYWLYLILLHAVLLLNSQSSEARARLTERTYPC